jgi:hypothetical protein
MEKYDWFKHASEHSYSKHETIADKLRTGTAPTQLTTVAVKRLNISFAAEK